MDEEIKETLKKQLELLLERSKKPDSNLPELTHAMVEIIPFLAEPRYQSFRE